MRIISKLILVLIGSLAISISCQNSAQLIELLPAPSAMEHCLLTIGDDGKGAAISLRDSTIYVTQNGGGSWTGPISLGHYKQYLGFESELKVRYKISNGYLFMFLADYDDWEEKHLTFEGPEQHLAKFNLTTHELTLSSEKFSQVDEIIVTDTGVAARLHKDYVVEFDDNLSVLKRYKLPTEGCLAMVPYNDGYCAMQHGKLFFIEEGEVLSSDIDLKCLKWDLGPLFSSSQGTIYSFCFKLRPDESFIFRVNGPNNNIEPVHTFEWMIPYYYYSCGDAFFIIGRNKRYNYKLVYSLDGGENWSIQCLPRDSVNGHHMAYYGGKLIL